MKIGPRWHEEGMWKWEVIFDALDQAWERGKCDFRVAETFRRDPASRHSAG